MRQGRRTVFGIVIASALALAVTVDVGQGAAPERMGFGAYGDARIGDTPRQVRSKIAGVESCRRLGGRCVCASVEVGGRSVTFVYRLDRRPGADLIFTSSSAVRGPRGIRVGDSARRLKRLFPHTKRLRPIYGGYQRFAVYRHRVGLLALARGGRIIQLTTGKRRFFHYEEYCS